LAQGIPARDRADFPKELPVKHAIVICHPSARSFTASVAKTYADVCGALGDEVIIRDLYRMGFDPCLKSQELPFDPAFEPGSDVLTERNLLGGCDTFAFFYPLWLNSPPAMIKGYWERVFGFGFAYGARGHSYTPLLTGRKLISFSSSGAPASWMQESGNLPAVRALFDSSFAAVCGMSVLDHVHFGGILPGASAPFVQARLEEVQQTVNRHFRRITCH
jgi:NAD(P)H dehydrogenase (quinone)